MRAGNFTSFQTAFRAGFRALRLGGLLLASGLMLSACIDGGTGNGTGLAGSKAQAVKPGQFQTRYDKARDALEAGKYSRAISSYRALLPQAGPLAPRVQLELAHALLRNGDLAEAAQLAGALANSPAAAVGAEQTDNLRPAALSVRGTAQHELGLIALQSGQLDQAAALLKSADAAMAEVLKSGTSLDPLGALAGRRAAIKVQLAGMSG